MSSTKFAIYAKKSLNEKKPVIYLRDNHQTKIAIIYDIEIAQYIEKCMKNFKRNPPVKNVLYVDSITGEIKCKLEYE